jgi:hypothetical protein
MTTTTDPRITPSVQTYREQQIAFWRAEARENLILGFMDLARRCEGFACDWEGWDEVPTCDEK